LFKKLDILILKAFFGPFLAALTIATFVLTMQFFWLYIDDLVGKGLDAITILQLIGLVSVSTFTTALPLSLLFSAIMTFGNLGESFELIAIKAAGISLLRFMRPLFIFTLFLSAIAFLFANNIIPATQLKLNTLKYEIIVSKPALDIKEGIFYDKIDGYVIKLGKKESNDSVIRNIVIFEKKFNLQDNMLIASAGVMRVSKDKKFLEFIMYDGWRYQERGMKNTTNTEFTRLYFKEYKKVFNLSSFQMIKGNENIYDPKMLSIRQLTTAIDSLKNNDSLFYKKMNREVMPYLKFMKYKDSANVFTGLPNLPKISSFKEIISDSSAPNIIESLSYQFTSILNNIQSIKETYKSNEMSAAYHAIEWHRKFTLSFACIVLFLIGAPLGSIIRKGGLGTPLVLAIVFFVLFFLLNNFGEKFAKSGEWAVYKGMWLSTAILIPIGIFLIYKALHDAQLFNKEFYYRLLQSFKVTLHRYFKK